MTAPLEPNDSDRGACPFCLNTHMATTPRTDVLEMAGAQLAYLDDHDDDLVALTRSLLAFDTQNPPGATRAVIDHTEGLATDLGLQTERIVADETKPNLLVTLPGETDATLLYNGHVDTVPYDAAAWTHDPLGERVGDRVYGRGATDMKGAVAVMLYALKAYVETDTTPPVTLQVALVSDEETAGDAGLPTLLDRDMLIADACVIGETTCEAGSHSVTVADKGSIWLTLEATGTAAHGSRPSLGENAIDRLIDAITAIRAALTHVTFDLDDDVAAIVEDSVSFYAPRMDSETAWRLFTAPTLNVGTIRGGRTINQVPDSATAELDVRLTAGVHTPTILARLETVLEEHPHVSIADVSWSIGTAEPVDSPLVDATARLAGAIVDEPVHRRSATGGGDAKTLRNAGIPTIEFAFGTDTAHAVDEYVTVSALRNNAAVFAALPYGYAALAGHTDPLTVRASTDTPTGSALCDTPTDQPSTDRPSTGE